MALLEVEAMETYYGGSQALFGVNFTVEQGGVTALLGRNGMGKTTAVTTVMWLLQPHRGRVRFAGEEQQMLASGRALMTTPRLLILDEATEGLAPLVRAEIWSCLSRLKQAGLSLLVINKNLAPLLRLADQHIILDTGRVAWSGSS